MAELKPCPFCGGEAILDMDESWYWEWQVFCPHCEATQGHFINEQAAREAWNRRVGDTT